MLVLAASPQQCDKATGAEIQWEETMKTQWNSVKGHWCHFCHWISGRGTCCHVGRWQKKVYYKIIGD